MVIKTNPEDFQSYLEDTSNLKGKASMLYIPDSKEEVSGIVQDCVDKRIPFTICAGRTGTAGGCVPLGGAVISLEKLKNIEIDSRKRLAYVEAGVSLEELDQQASKYNLTLRASPTESLAFVGGAVSTSASGVRGFGYGSIRNYVRELEAVLPTGKIIKLQRGEITSKKRMFDFSHQGSQDKFLLPSYTLPRVKSQAGYFVNDNMDLIDLFIGSEGTLGIITSCSLLLQKVPFNTFDGLAFFKQERDAFSFVSKIRELKMSKCLQPASLEFFDANSLKMLKEKYSFMPACEAAVYFEQEAGDQKSYSQLIEEWAHLIEENGASLDESILGQTSQERRRIFDIRHKLPQMINEFLRQNNQVKTAADIAVPWENFSQMYNFYKKEAGRAGIAYVNFGHIGESHLHFNFLPRNDQENAVARKYLKIFCEKAVALGGTVSAEHGIGKIKKPYLEIMYRPQDIRQMAALKKHFDPHCLFGLDNIFDKKYLL